MPDIDLLPLHNVLAKSVGSNTPINLVRATIKGLQAMHNPESVAANINLIQVGFDFIDDRFFFFPQHFLFSHHQ